MPFLLGNWRVLVYVGLLLVCAAAVGVTRYQLLGCRAEHAKAQANYEILAARVAEQNRAVEALEQAAKEAAAKARQARDAAAKTVRIATDKAQSLERALAAPRAPSDCPAGDAARVVRADLAAQ